MTDIIEYADSLSEDVAACREGRGECDIHERFLEVAVFRRVGSPENYKVEFLVTCGGPTVRVTVNDDDTVRLYHSWGKDKKGNDRHECDFRSEHTEMWRSLAEEFNELAGE